MILFLDIDGVLHPDSVYLERRRPVLRGPGHLFMWCDSLIEALEPWPDVSIVLSSSWVRFRGYDRTRDALPAALRDRVIGATYHTAMSRRPPEEGGFRLPLSWWDNHTRYEQILGYVRRAGLTDTEWLAIDDNCERWAPEHARNLILTTSERGISDPAALALLQARLTELRSQKPGTPV